MLVLVEAKPGFALHRECLWIEVPFHSWEVVAALSAQKIFWISLSFPNIRGHQPSTQMSPPAGQGPASTPWRGWAGSSWYIGSEALKHWHRI